MQDLIIIAIVAAVIAVAGLYVYRKKKSGAACIGCPHSKTCSAAKNGCCSCGK